MGVLGGSLGGPWAAHTQKRCKNQRFFNISKDDKDFQPATETAESEFIEGSWGSQPGGALAAFWGPWGHLGGAYEAIGGLIKTVKNHKEYVSKWIP